MSDEDITFLPSPLPQSGQYKAIRGIFCFAYILGLLALPIYVCGEVSKKGCQPHVRVSTGQGSCPVKEIRFQQILRIWWNFVTVAIS